MPRNSESLKIIPWAALGDRTNPDDTSLAVPLDRDYGFPASFSEAGGNTPARRVMNQIFNEITGMLDEINKKGILEWIDSIAYQSGAVVQHGGLLYVALSANTDVEPPGDGSVWRSAECPQGTDTPGVPHSFSLTPIYLGFIYFWRAPEDMGSAISRYDVEYQNTAAGTQRIQMQSTSPNRIELTGLVVGARYQVRVRAVNANGAGDWSGYSISTPVSDTIGRPQGSTFLSAHASDGGALLQWTHSSSQSITDTLVQWRMQGEMAWTSVVVPYVNSSGSFPVSGLPNNQIFEAQAYARNPNGDGNLSNRVLFQPRAAGSSQDALGHVDGFNAIVAAPQIINIRWTYTAMVQNLSFKVRWRRTNTQAFIAGNAAEYGGLIRFAAIEMPEGGDWFIDITPASGVNLGDTRSVASITVPARPVVAAPAIPENIALDSGLDIVIVTFDAVSANPPISSYQVQWRSGSQSYSNARSLSSSVPAITIQRLNPSTLYYVRVRASNSEGDSAWSQVYSIFTVTEVAANTAPDAPVLSISATNQIEWNIPDDNGSSITGYNLEITNPFGTFDGTNYTPTVMITTISAGITSYRGIAFSMYRARAVNSVGSSPYSNSVTGSFNSGGFF